LPGAGFEGNSILKNKTQIKFLWIVLLFTTLACRAATRLVIPDTPTPLPTSTSTPTLTPTLPPTLTATPVFEAACPDLVAEILDTGATEIILSMEKSDESFEEDEIIILISYEVSGDKISGPRNQTVPEELEDERSDRARHAAIWNYFTAIIPADERALLSEFYIFTDGRGGHFAAVGPTFTDPEEWVLDVDILDAASYYDLTYTLIHEHGHLLTLNSGQVPPSKAIFKFPDNKTVKEQEVAACPQYFPDEGCSEPDSYINRFFERFWAELYPEWEQIDLVEDEDTRFTLLEDFYRTYRDQFVTDYAATSPAEDIAESWTAFVLSPRTEGNAIADEKTSFFYEYPKLIELRTQILKRVCAEFPQ